MYIWSICLLLLLAGASGYMLGQFPYALVFAVALCAAIEVLIRRYYLKHAKLQVPFSGIITGLIRGSVAPIGVPLLPILIACVVAVFSKFFVKVKSVNVFNPAALGLLVGLGIFSIGSSWWTTSTVNLLGMAVSMAVLLVVAAYEARRLVLAFSFIVTLVLFSVATSPPISLANFEIALLSVNCFFAFLMLTEPKTSPPKKRAQLAYGIYVALVYALFVVLTAHSLFFAEVDIFLALLIGNLTYAIYRSRGQKIL